MSDENLDNDSNNNNEDVEVSQEELMEFYKSNKDKVKDFDSIVAKKDELLGETKAAKKAREEALEKLKKYEKERQEALEKNGEYKTIAEQLKQDLENERAERLQEKEERKQEKLSYQAMKLANKLADGNPDSAELLSTFIEQSLKELADDNGNLKDGVLKDVEKHFTDTPKYAPLITGTKATGGGAKGGTVKQTEKSFNEMSEAERVTLYKESPEKYREMKKQSK